MTSQSTGETCLCGTKSKNDICPKKEKRLMKDNVPYTVKPLRK